MSTKKQPQTQSQDKGSEKRRTIGEYTVLKKIGSGSFANVWLCSHQATGVQVAIKSVNRDKLRLNKKHQENMESEIAIMKKVNHPNLLSLLDIQSTERHIYLVLEYCPGGDLAKFIKKHGPMPESIARYYLLQLAAGLRYLNSQSMVHRDLKPQNLLLSGNSEGSSSSNSLIRGLPPLLKIADFGFARSLAPESMAQTLCGSPLYMAPEILRYQKYDGKADLWSVGAILFELVTGNPPFSGANQMQLLQMIETKELQFPPNMDPPLSQECTSLLRSLLRRNAADRSSFSEFFNHPFLTNPSPSPTIPIGSKQPSSTPLMTRKLSSTDRDRSSKRQPQSEQLTEDERLNGVGIGVMPVVGSAPNTTSVPLGRAPSRKSSGATRRASPSPSPYSTPQESHSLNSGVGGTMVGGQVRTDTRSQLKSNPVPGIPPRSRLVSVASGNKLSTMTGLRVEPIPVPHRKTSNSGSGNPQYSRSLRERELEKEREKEEKRGRDDEFVVVDPVGTRARDPPREADPDRGEDRDREREDREEERSWRSEPQRKGSQPKDRAQPRDYQRESVSQRESHLERANSDRDRNQQYSQQSSSNTRSRKSSVSQRQRDIGYLEDGDNNLYDEDEGRDVERSPRLWARGGVNVGDFTNEKEALASFQSTSKRAWLVAVCGDMKRQESGLPPSIQASCALALYTRALCLFSWVIYSIEAWQRMGGMMGGMIGAMPKRPSSQHLAAQSSGQAPANSFPSAAVQTWLEWDQEMFETYTSRARELATEVMEDGVETVVCVEQLLYEQILKLCQDGAYEESLGNNDNAMRHYRNGYRLLEHLVCDLGSDSLLLAGFVGEQSLPCFPTVLPGADQVVLGKLFNDVSARITYLRDVTI